MVNFFQHSGNIDIFVFSLSLYKKCLYWIKTQWINTRKKSFLSVCCWLLLLVFLFVLKFWEFILHTFVVIVCTHQPTHTHTNRNGKELFLNLMAVAMKDSIQQNYYYHSHTNKHTFSLLKKINRKIKIKISFHTQGTTPQGTIYLWLLSSSSSSFNSIQIPATVIAIIIKTVFRKTPNTHTQTRQTNFLIFVCVYYHFGFKHNPGERSNKTKNFSSQQQ